MEKNVKTLILTVDLEWYYPGNKTGRVNDFDTLTLKQRVVFDNGRIEKSIFTILEILKRHNQKITFFVVAELDQVYSKLIKGILREGHEIALHSFRHKESLNIYDFEKDLNLCKLFQKKYKVIGYRAPRIKIEKNYYPILRKHGFKYDSSVYGTKGFYYEDVKILPVSILPFFGKNVQNIPSSLSIKLLSQSVPFGSGMFIGLLQKKEFIIIDKYASTYKNPACLFLHSWQVNNSFYSLKAIMRNPSFFVYSMDCKNLLELICKKYKLLRIRDTLK